MRWIKLLKLRIWDFLHQLREQPSQTDARYDVEEQTCIHISLSADRDENLSCDRVADEKCCRNAAHPFQYPVDSWQPADSWKKFGGQYAEQTDEEGHEGPSHHAAAETVDDGAAEDDAEEIRHVVMESHQYLLAISGIEYT